MREVIKKGKVYKDGSKIDISGIIYTQKWSNTFNCVKNVNAKTRPDWINSYIQYGLHYYCKK